MKPATSLSSAFNVNHNVLYTFIYKFSDGIAQGVWSLASMATYIYLLENNSTRVHRLSFRVVALVLPYHNLETAFVFAVCWACSGHSGYLCSYFCSSRHVAQVVYCCESSAIVASFPVEFTCGVLPAAGWLADRFRRDRVLKCCAVASCGKLHMIHMCMVIHKCVLISWSIP